METSNLHIPLIAGDQQVKKEKINEQMQAIDAAALPVSHVGSRAHFALWQPETWYYVGDVVRVESCPSWGFLECTTQGESGSTAPTSPAGEDGTVNDGTVTWTLRRLTRIIRSHGDLTGRSSAGQHPIGAITGLQAALDALGGRVITFIGNDVEIRYPWAGTATQIQINCKTAREADLAFEVQRQSREDYEAQENNWSKVGGQTLNLLAGDVYTAFTVSDSVAADDMLRFHTASDDSDITVQLFIQNR